MRIGGRRLRVEWGHLALLALIAGVVVAYLLDARARSVHVNNLLLVQPASFLALGLCAFVLRQCFTFEPGAAPPTVRDREAFRQELLNLARVGAMVTVFGLFAFSLETVGFDIAAWAFVAAGLYICGERNWLVLAVFPVAFTAALIYFFRALVPFPLPTGVL